MEGFIDDCEGEHWQTKANKMIMVEVSDGNESDYTDLSDAEDDYGSEASTIKCIASRAPPRVKKSMLKKKKKNKKSKKRSKRSKRKISHNDDSKEDGAGALLVEPTEDVDDETLTLTAPSEQASASSAGGSLYEHLRHPAFICGLAHDIDSDMLYLVKWADMMEPTMDYVLAEFVNQMWPELVVQFYDDFSHRLLNGQWTVADYGSELYFFLNYDEGPPETLDDDADWTEPHFY